MPLHMLSICLASRTRARWDTPPPPCFFPPLSCLVRRCSPSVRALAAAAFFSPKNKCKPPCLSTEIIMSRSSYMRGTETIMRRGQIPDRIRRWGAAHCPRRRGARADTTLVDRRRRVCDRAQRQSRDPVSVAVLILRMHLHRSPVLQHHTSVPKRQNHSPATRDKHPRTLTLLPHYEPDPDPRNGREDLNKALRRHLHMYGRR